MQSLYERLGGTDGITAIGSDLVDLHMDNRRIAPRYAASDPAVLDDALAALQRNGIGRREQEEVLFILYGMKGEIVQV